MNCTLSATRGKNTTNKLDKRLQRSTETVIRKAANCRGGDTIDSGGPAIHAVQASKTVFATSPCAPASNRRAAVPRPRIQLSPPLRLSLSLPTAQKKKSQKIHQLPKPFQRSRRLGYRCRRQGHLPYLIRFNQLFKRGGRSRLRVLNKQTPPLINRQSFPARTVDVPALSRL
jgi:hypothetical protein